MSRFLLLCTLLSTAIAHTPAVAADPTTPCASKEARAFDFWIGSWTVSSPDGKVLGENEIERLLGGCVLMENWRDAKGDEGKSWNYWDAPSKTWKQHWVDAQGRVTEYTGSAVPDGMRFEAREPERTLVMTFRRRDDGSIEQKIEGSRDGGKTWRRAFLGIYRKR